MAKKAEVEGRILEFLGLRPQEFFAPSVIAAAGAGPQNPGRGGPEPRQVRNLTDSAQVTKYDKKVVMWAGVVFTLAFILRLWMGGP